MKKVATGESTPDARLASVGSLLPEEGIMKRRRSRPVNQRQMRVWHLSGRSYQKRECIMLLGGSCRRLQARSELQCRTTMLHVGGRKLAPTYNAICVGDNLWQKK